MLDTDTRRRIDTARDILVGKVPDPKSQVEQITIALIYKFMNDMDAESEELGGKRTFFADEFERYGWARLMTPRIGGQEMLNLYSEAITRMPENPGIPALFRDIFKNAYLPYRDPETLRAFLKVIDDFTYDHSERLGDAFEYLLSVLGSQGDAGQFRTPRHIIDFMVAIVDPRKDERILDPACGTAGFLISAYKHILNANSLPVAGGNGDGIRPGAALSPDERKRLMGNVHGYDISPDMVRLSLVNLYLHGFNNPRVDEYDTLTSEDKWNDYYHVILANPPFMSPKGGIRPHKRFTVQSNRSEVLFVDYIAEHLLPGGRAAVIVPEGVIFQSGNAYKQLRKLLVEQYLAGVISLPAGVFNPYSGVKTSILWLDKTIAKQTDSILFVKIEADGFDLGAQRKEIKRNDLPEALAGVLAYKDSIAGGDQIETSKFPGLSVIKREFIANHGDYNLSGEKYRTRDRVNSAYPLVKIGEICDLVVGGTPSRSNPGYWHEGTIKWISSKYINDNGRVTGFELITEEAVKASSTSIVPKESTIIISRVSVGKVAYADDNYALNQDLTALIPKDRNVLNPSFLFAISKRIGKIVEANAQGIGVRGVTQKFLADLEIPLPPLAEQEAIVAEVESYQRIIDGARQVVANYRPRIEIDPAWPVVGLGEVARVKGGKRLPKGQPFSEEPTSHPYIRVSDFKDYSVDLSNLRYISEDVFKEISQYTIDSGNVYISIAGTIGILGTIPIELNGANLTENAAKLVFDNQVLNDRFLALVGSSEYVQWQIRRLTHAVGVPKLALERIKTINIPLPDIDTQTSIVDAIECERTLVQSNRELITRFEEKIKARIGRVWGEAA